MKKISIYAALLTTTMFSASANANTHITYTSYANTNSIQTNIGGDQNRWFWNVTAQNSTTVSPSSKLDLSTFYTENYANHRGHYIQGSIIQSIPLLGPAIEKSLDRAIDKRLRKTQEYISDSVRFDQLMHELELYNSLALNSDAAALIARDVEGDIYHYMNELGRHNSAYNMNVQPIYQDLLQPINHSAFNDIDSVLSYFSYARQLPGMRLRAEIGYKKDNFEWRIGGQKHRSADSLLTNERQKRQSVYSTMDWDISAKFNYMNYYVEESLDNYLGIEDFEHERSSEYHRLSYRFGQEASVYVGHGKHHNDILGNARYTQIGAQKCNNIANDMSLCSNLRFERSHVEDSFSESINGHYSGITAGINLDYRF
ncbi:MAG: hypothetical protein VYC19_02835 [Pseudomonadota bacterium]|jgi:hypothetical protein|nr:hypothetical protein [Pseudomonadota bacterium]MEC9236905.1 hypothetical protein [Pseudomonadota bacterium]